MQAAIIPFRRPVAFAGSIDTLHDVVIDNIRQEYSDRPVLVLAEAAAAALRVLEGGGSYIEAIDVAETICRVAPPCDTDADRNFRRLRAWRERRLHAFLDLVCRNFDDLFPDATPTQRHTAIARARRVLEQDGPLSAAMLAGRY